MILYFHATPEMEADKKTTESTVEPKEDATPATEAETQEETVVPEITAEEKLKKREAEMMKGTQKLLDEKKEIERKLQLSKDIISEGKKIASDEKYLIELHYSKPEVAKGILDEYYNGMSFEEFVQSKELEDNIPAKIEAEANKKADEIVRQKELKLTIAQFQRDMEYDVDTQKAFMEELEETYGDALQKMSPDRLERVLQKTHKLIVFDSEDIKETKKQERIAAQAGIGEGSAAWKGTVEKKDPRVEQILNHRKS